MKKISVTIYSLLLTVFVGYIMPVSMLKYYPYGDATIFNYFGYAMNKGEKLYIDIFDHKGPIIFFINYIGYNFYGGLGIKIIYLITIFLFFIFSYKVIKIFSDKKSVAYITLLMLMIIFLTIYEHGLGLEGYMLPLITYSLYVYLEYFINKNINNIRIIIVGICFSLVFFTKINMVGLWLILSIIVIIKLMLEKEYKKIWIFILNFCIGIAVVVIPLIIYFIINNSLYEMIYQSFIVNLSYTGDSPTDKYQILSWVIRILNSYMLPIIIALVSIFYYKKNKVFVICGLILLVFCILASIISKREYLHYLIVLIPLFIPYIAIFIDKILDVLNMKIGVMLILIALLVIYFPHLNNIREQRYVRNQDNAVYIRKASEYIKLNTKEDDRIYGHRIYGSVYLLADRLSSTKYFFIPGFHDDSIFLEDFKMNLEQDLPVYIVVDDIRLFNMKIDKYILDVIDKEYVFEKEFSSMKVYRKK